MNAPNDDGKKKPKVYRLKKDLHYSPRKKKELFYKFESAPEGFYEEMYLMVLSEAGSVTALQFAEKRTPKLVPATAELIVEDCKEKEEYFSALECALRHLPEQVVPLAEEGCKHYLENGIANDALRIMLCYLPRKKDEYLPAIMRKMTTEYASYLFRPEEDTSTEEEVTCYKHAIETLDRIEFIAKEQEFKRDVVSYQDPVKGKVSFFHLDNTIRDITCKKIY